MSKDTKDMSVLTEKYTALQAKRIQAKKDLIALKNDIASKDELWKMQQKKYEEMKLEIEQRGQQIKNLEAEIDDYAHMDPKAAALTSQSDAIEKFLGKRNMKKELNQILYDENKKADDKYMIGNNARDFDESVEELLPDEEVYHRSMTESITIKCVKKRKINQNNKRKDDDEDDLKKLSSIMSFRINKDTTFNQLFTSACNFWETSKYGSDYFLTDEAGAQLPEGNRVEEYFKSQMQDIHNVILILRPREPSKHLTVAMIDAISSGDQQASGQVGNLFFTRTKKIEVDGYQEFFNDFPGMKNYIDEDKLRETKKIKILTEEEKRHRFIDDNHCCVAFLIFLIMLISLICIPLDRNPFYDNKLQKSLFNVLWIGDDFSENPISYYNIRSLQGIFSYFGSCVMQVANTAPKMLQNNVYVGPMRIRQVRTKKMDECVVVAGSTQTISCYHDIYNEDTRDNTTFPFPVDYDWRYFRTAEENKIESHIVGLSQMYDGSGYVANFNMLNMTVFEASTIFYSMYTANWLDLGTRAVFITANLYNPGFGRFIEIYLGFEFTTGGYVVPMPPSVSIYRFIRYATEHYGFRYEILQGIAACLLLIFLLYMTFTNEHGRRAWNFKYWLTFPALSTLALIVLVFESINSNQKLRDMNLDLMTVYTSQTSFDSMSAVINYKDTILFESLGVFVAAVRLMYFLRLSRNFELIIATISQAGIIFIQYIFTLIPIIAAFGVVGMLLWGDVSMDFNIRGNAFISVMALALGHFDTEILNDADIYLTAILLTLYYMFFIFFLITVFTSLAIDTYRFTQMERNADEKKTDFKLFAWLFSWVPTKYMQMATDWGKAKWNAIKAVFKGKEEDTVTKTESMPEILTESPEKTTKKKDKENKPVIKIESVDGPEGPKSPKEQDIQIKKEKNIEMRTVM